MMTHRYVQIVKQNLIVIELVNYVPFHSRPLNECILHDNFFLRKGTKFEIKPPINKRITLLFSKSLHYF